MKQWKAPAALAAALVALGCGTGESATPSAGSIDGPCAADVRVGGFEAALQDGFTSVQGKVEDRVSPRAVPRAVASSGACQLHEPPRLACDPACDGGTTCDSQGQCVQAARAMSVGQVSVFGLAAPVEMSASAPVYFYTNRGPLDHPGFAPGAELTLVASGDEDVAEFSLTARGVAAMSSDMSSAALESGQPVELTWAPPAVGDDVTIDIELNIAQHGGNPAWISCTVEDTGAFSIPVELSDALLERGYSGFPSVTITRHSVDSADTELGCVDWSARSELTLTVDIPGLTSCSSDDDCPTGTRCRGDLTCGPQMETNNQ